MTKKTKSTLLALLKVAVAMTIFVVAVINYEELKNIDVRAIIESSSSTVIAVFTLWGVYLLKSILFIIPASLIYIAIGMAFPTSWACLISLIGIIIEVTATYLLGRFLGGAYVNDLLRKTKGGAKILDLNLNNKFITLFPIRALPVFPIDFLSLFLGASKCNFLIYFITSVVGIMPRVVLFTILGDGIYDYIPIHLIIKIVIFCIPVGCAIYLIRHFIKQKKES